LTYAITGFAAVVAVAIWQPWHRVGPADGINSKLQTQNPKPIDLSSDKSIAVLPFENHSDDKENTAFFADGMHEDILTSLANIRDLKVISRTSVMEYRGTTMKLPQIARELGVAYILEGSVRRAGSQVKITGQLIRAANDEHLWAKSYERELTPKEVFAIQASLATEIAGALKAVIAPETKKLLER
jgi:TolB-like protein